MHRHTGRNQARPPDPTGPSPSETAAGLGGSEVHVEVQETEHEVIVMLALGWVVHDSIVVRCAGRSLTIEAERYARPSNTHVTAAGWRCGEALRRTIALPCDVRSAQASARYRQGMLTVHIPREVPLAAPRPH
jgi:HSP20 family molecular chaperone IbpA